MNDLQDSELRWLTSYLSERYKDTCGVKDHKLSLVIGVTPLPTAVSLSITVSHDDFSQTADIVKYEGHFDTVREIVCGLVELAHTEGSLPEVPEAVSAITGYRVFIVTGTQVAVESGNPIEEALHRGLDNPGLKGSFDQHWPTAKMTAQCLCYTRSNDAIEPNFAKHIHSHHRSCGIYIVKSPANLARGSVIAEMTGWGRAYEYELGYRVEHARIDKLVVSEDYYTGSTLKQLEARYDVPVEVLDGCTWEALKTANH